MEAGAGNHPPLRHAHAGRHQQALGQFLVDSNSRHGGRGMGIAQADQIHQPLHRAILTGGAVQGIENHIRPAVEQAIRQRAPIRRALPHIERRHIMAQRPRRGHHAGT